MTARNVLITGASSGIGAALATAYARRGARIALLARREAELQQVADAVRAAGGDARVYPVDVVDGAAVRDAVDDAERAWGPVERAIANAGISKPFLCERFPLDDLVQVMRVNVEGAATVFAAVVPRMVERRAGHVVGVSSIAGFRGLPTSAPYSASKAALSMLMEVMRFELAPHGVAATCVHPGFVRTPIVQKNRFWMPFLTEVDDAAALLVRRLDRRPPTVDFPLPMVAAMRLVRALPAPLWRFIGAQAVRRLPPV